MLGWDVLPNQDSHLQGQHTVRMSPISTAFLNPYGQTYCLAGSSSSVLIPILLNNSNPTAVHYSVYPLGYKEGSGMKVVSKTISSREVKAIEAAHLADLQAARVASRAEREEDDYDDYDDDDNEPDTSSSSRLQKSQSLLHIPITQTGTIHLDSVKDASGVDARIVYPSSATVAPCPRAEFRTDDVLARGDNVRCAASDVASTTGDSIELQMTIFGVPPLSLKWYKEINGRQEYFMVEGIEAGHDESSRANPPASQSVEVPLLVQARALGTHVYALDSVTDALGNTENLRAAAPLAVATKNATAALAADANPKTTRVLHVLRRPAVAFRGCSPVKPAALKIDSEINLSVQLAEADPLDGPWDVIVRYQPPIDGTTVSSTRKLRPWEQTMQTEANRKDLRIQAGVPGQYKIVHIKGKHCEGDILNPDTCAVVELPKPTAEIDWKRIHEWCAVSSKHVDRVHLRYF
jgi:nucleoporin POM152